MGYKTYTCEVSKRCGGCQWLAVPYPIQLKRKQEMVEELFADVGAAAAGGGRSFSVSPIVGMETPLHCRNKILVPFAPGPKGSVRFGLFAQGTHRIVPTDSCLIEDERAKPILETIARLCKRFKIAAYDEDAQKGFLRYVLIRIAYFTGEILVTFVCADDNFPGSKAFVKELRKKHPEITTVVMNINKRVTNIVLGERERVLFGNGWISDQLCGCTFRISSSAFYQVNPLQTEKLYETAIALAQLDGTQTILDAYCGTGTIGIIASRYADALVGVESNVDAVRDAKTNARNNGVKNARFFCADASEFMEECAASEESPDVVFMDPPRSGSDEKFLKALCMLAPARIVYISCNPTTQRRDAEYLLAHGYRIEAIQPVDMFPHTPHVETVVLFTRD